jgi:hypothetical protein
MITSKQIDKLFERFLTRHSSGWSSVDIFENPDSSDIKELYQSDKNHQVRFLADKDKKKVWVWNINSALHGEVSRVTGVYNSFNKIVPFGLFSGDGYIQNGKTVMRNSDSLDLMLRVVKADKNKEMVNEREYLNDILSDSWTWLSRYVDFSGFANKIKGVL